MHSGFFGEIFYELVELRSYNLLNTFLDFVHSPDILSVKNTTSLFLLSQKLKKNESENIEMVKFLIRSGADVLWRDEYTGSSPAFYIIKFKGKYISA